MPRQKRLRKPEQMFCAVGLSNGYCFCRHSYSAIWSSTGRPSDHAQRLPLVPAAMRYPPICFRTCSTSIKVEMAPIWAFCAAFD
jgi:hypothetical protein